MTDNPDQLKLKLSRLEGENAELHKQMSIIRWRERIFEATSDSLLDSIFSKDADRRYTFANRVMARLLKLPVAEILGKTPEEVFPPDSAAVIREVDDRTFAGEQVNEVRRISINGHEFSFHTVQVPLTWDGDRVTSICGIVRDVTERVNMEQELRRCRERLEGAVQQRSEELHETTQRLLVELEERRRMERQLLDVAGEERQRIGQNLHDGLGQVITGVKYQLETICRRAANQGEADLGALSQISESLQEVISQTRSIARGLMPVDVSEDGLTDALKQLASEMSKVYMLDCRVELQKDVVMASHVVATELFLIAQEAVSNACRHAEAENIVIRLDVNDGEGVLVIRDDGSGIKDVESAGLGLGIMHYRANVIDATLSIGDAPEGGTLVECLFPMAS